MGYPTGRILAESSNSLEKRKSFPIQREKFSKRKIFDVRYIKKEEFLQKSLKKEEFDRKIFLKKEEFLAFLELMVGYREE